MHTILLCIVQDRVVSRSTFVIMVVVNVRFIVVGNGWWTWR